MNTIPLEKDIQRGILDYLTMKGIFHWRNNTGSFSSEYKGKSRFISFGAPGSPDIIAVRNGTCYGIEVKRPKGVQSESQKEFERAFTKAGGVYVLARSIDDVLFIK